MAVAPTLEQKILSSVDAKPEDAPDSQTVYDLEDPALFITRQNPSSELRAFDFRLTCPPQKSQMRCNMFSYDCLSGCSRNIGLDYGFHETFVTGGINNENYT